MTGKSFRIQAEVVNGKCPTCDEHTMLVGLSKDFFRCMTCGTDLQQHINGKITYLPAFTPNTSLSTLKHFFVDGEA